ncbi:MAG: sarcosine oxidase subunit delta [Rhizobiaceae bacterium]
MLLIRCPYCEEERPELEFRNMGQAHVMRSTDLANQSDEDFEKFLYIRDNPKGVSYERWRHVHGCGRFFNAARHTVSDKFIVTYKAGEAKPALGGTAPKAVKPAAPAKAAAAPAKAVKPATTAKAARPAAKTKKGEA